MKDKINLALKNSHDRITFCIELINEYNLKAIAELGVYRGEYAQEVLEKCPGIETYTMIDPWRNLADWNKPSNKDNDTFEEFFQETMQRTDFAKEKRIVLRGKTTEVINQIEDAAYDFVYIDGDHTLKGIAIDLINFWPKVKENGVIVGDDFFPSIWQNSERFEPTMVCPFAVYFAEAVNAKIYALPHGQFLLIKNEESSFEFIDLTDGLYNNLEIRTQMLNTTKSSIKRVIRKRIPFALKVYAALKR